MKTIMTLIWALAGSLFVALAFEPVGVQAEFVLGAGTLLAMSLIRLLRLNGGAWRKVFLALGTGVVLRYRTTKAAEVARLFAALHSAARDMAGLPADEAVVPAADEGEADDAPEQGVQAQTQAPVQAQAQAQGGAGKKRRKGKK